MMGDRERDRGEGKEVMMLGRERASVEDGRVWEGWVDKVTERGMGSARETWEGGRKRAE